MCRDENKMHPPEPQMVTDPSIPFHIDLLQKLNGELTERTAAHGACHPSIAETLNSIALIHHHMRHDSRKALRIHTKALRILGVFYRDIMAMGDGRDRATEIAISFAITLSDIGNVHWALGDLARAETAFYDAIHILDFEDVTDAHPRKYSIRNRLLTLHRNPCLVSETANISRGSIKGTPPILPAAAPSAASAISTSPKSENESRDHHSEDLSMTSEDSNSGKSGSIKERSFEAILNSYQRDVDDLD